ncbi:histone-like nucleoid-structuring protein Lsr2 [Agromyces archimandritae]|uniref:Lsr2 family protein n=1 Tax=Agromyces archimandritae TaxID=2781962 RepID=A0A975FP63_9MICO|nr:Lsr2 family protein [Agromyces archimandritae]QTX06015.1 Lsr2 family protein [Agromyces archimandritae]
MARKIIHQLVDDLDGTVLEPGDGETVQFALDGRAFEIDLTEANAKELRDALAPYLKAGRSLRAGAPAPRRAPRRNPSGRDLNAIREWARGKGHKVSDRGRVSEAILAEYDAAH